MTDIRICFVGDSFVNGTGDEKLLGWTGRVCRNARKSRYSITAYNLGVRRDTSADIAARWQEECRHRLPPDCDGRVVFSFGANDTMVENGQTRLTSDASERHAESILRAAAKRYKTLFIGPAAVADGDHNERTVGLDNVLREVSSRCGVPYLSVIAPLRKSYAWMKEVLSGDGAHPGSGGYTEMADLVLRWPEWWFR
ncbi:MAG: GDSL-type esterase/lipase family protein [Armatimonadota bacterium]|nr:GDSL-type esterase/lipase family protein [Armatimonadota bacterium]